LAAAAPLDEVARLISHKEPRVRKEVLAYLERLPDPKAKTYLLKFLRDDSSALRIRALQVLGKSKLPHALKPIAALAAAEDFDERDMAERKAVFEALGEVGGAQLIPTFRNMLLKKFWFNKTKEKESVICAVSGLVRVRDAEAVRVLEEAKSGKSDELKGIIAQAITALAAEREKGAAQQGGI
jgi:HEAT repeat protein